MAIGIKQVIMSRERKAFNSDKSSSSSSKKNYSNSKDSRSKSGKARTEKSDKPFRAKSDSGKGGETLKRVQRDLPC